LRSDVSKLSDLDRLFEVVAKKLGRIDVLFANAGIAKVAPVSDVSEGAYDDTFDINVKGVFFTIQKAIPYLNDNASVILNTSFVNQAGVPTTSVYAASKAAVRSLARSIASELAIRGIRVNVVSPGRFRLRSMESFVCPRRHLIMRRDPHRVAVVDIVRLYLRQARYPELLHRAMNVSALPQNWKAELPLRARTNHS
jgi:NAD(P)-dependent dehydrogenase (short-subunit alcohol dehydrogenase family)